MATVKTMLDNNGNVVYPTTRSEAVYTVDTEGLLGTKNAVVQQQLLLNRISKGSTLEFITVDTEAEWNLMTTSEKNDPTKAYFLPWK